MTCWGRCVNKDRGVKRLKNKKLMHVVRVKACSPNLLQKKERKKTTGRINLQKIKMLSSVLSKGAT